jgi:hypothetical protein
MLTPRDKVRITLLFAGIVLLVTSAAVSCAQPDEKKDYYVFRVGAWKDGPVAAAVPKQVVPWMLAGGAIAIIGAFASRER